MHSSNEKLGVWRFIGISNFWTVKPNFVIKNGYLTPNSGRLCLALLGFICFNSTTMRLYYLLCLLAVLLNDYKACSQTKIPLVLIASGGAAQNFMSINSSAIESVDGAISPLFGFIVFRYKPGLSYQTGVGVTLHHYDVKTISSSDRNLELTFVDVPLLARYHFSRSLSVSGGVSFAFKASTKSDFDLETGRPNPDNAMKGHESAKNAISNARFCSAYYFPFGLNVQVAYTKTLTGIFSDDSDGGTFGFLDIQIGYVIAGKRASDRLRNAGPVDGWP